MGVIEEGGKVAEGFLGAFKGQPLSLAMIVTNLALLALFWTILNTLATQREREVTQLHTEQKEIRDMLGKCVNKDSDTAHPGKVY